MDKSVDTSADKVRRFKVGDKAIAAIHEGKIDGKVVYVRMELDPFDSDFDYWVSETICGTSVYEVVDSELTPLADTDAPAPSAADAPADALRALWDSTERLFARFSLQQPPRAARKKLREEANELFDASNDGEPLPQMAKEGADTIVTVLGVLMAHGVTMAELEVAIQAVIEKNDAKTLENCHVDGEGMIVKGKAQS